VPKNKKYKRKKTNKIMKTKLFFIVVLSMLMSISLSASVEQVNLVQGQPDTHYYFCESITDSVIVYAPVAGGGFGSPGGSWIDADSVIITTANQGYWYYEVSGYSTIDFWIHFTTIAPTEPFASEELYKCSETSLVIPGQAEHQPDFSYLWGGG